MDCRKVLELVHFILQQPIASFLPSISQAMCSTYSTN